MHEQGSQAQIVLYDDLEFAVRNVLASHVWSIVHSETPVFSFLSFLYFFRKYLTMGLLNQDKR